MKCIQCHEKEIVIIKRKLCLYCSQKYYRQHRLTLNQQKTEVGHTTLVKYEMFHEVNFIKNFFTHNNWIHHPSTFHLNGTNYSPDFYDAERNTFIEVIGTRQAFHANKEKYTFMGIIFPKINFEVRDSFGNLIPLEGKQEWKTEKDD